MVTPIQFPSVMATGHRIRDFSSGEALWVRKELRKTMRRLREFHGLQEVISGMALGVDTWWAEAALDLAIPFAAYIPFEAQGARWPTSVQAHWRNLRSSASREVVLGEHYSVGLLHARNDAIIKDSSLAVAVLKSSKTSGGTFSAVDKLRKRKKPFILLEPEARTISKEYF